MKCSTDSVPPSRYAVFAAIAVVGCAIDLATKAWVFSVPALRNGEILWLWDGHAGVQLSRNWGALFGMGQGKVWLFAILSSIAMFAIPIWLFVFGAARDKWLNLALAFVMAGVLGNLYDRLGLSGEDWTGAAQVSGNAVHAVRDWILWQISAAWRWPNFNIADSLLVIGAAQLFLHAMRQPKTPPNSDTAKTA